VAKTTAVKANIETVLLDLSLFFHIPLVSCTKPLTKSNSQKVELSATLNLIVSSLIFTLLQHRYVY